MYRPIGAVLPPVQNTEHQCCQATTRCLKAPLHPPVSLELHKGFLTSHSHLVIHKQANGRVTSHPTMQSFGQEIGYDFAGDPDFHHVLICPFSAITPCFVLSSCWFKAQPGLDHQLPHSIELHVLVHQTQTVNRHYPLFR